MAFLTVATVALLVSSSYACSGVTYSTPADLGGDGDVVYLDRHNVSCPKDHLMSSFGLKRPGSNLMYYEYSCCHVPAINQCVERANEWTETKNAYYLDRQHLNCGPAGFVKSFILERKSRDNRYMRYRYTCCTVEDISECGMQHTQFNDDGKGNVFYLDRHNAKCPNGQLMQYFHLQRSYPTGMYRYDHTCCNVPFEICQTPTDYYERIYTCDASQSHEAMKCTYRKKVGTTRTTTTSEGNSITKETSQKLETKFKLTLGFSQVTQYDWRYESSDSFMEEQTFSVESICSAGSVCEMQQVIGACSQYMVRANYFRLKTFRPNTRSVEYTVLNI